MYKYLQLIVCIGYLSAISHVLGTFVLEMIRCAE